jgi:hypothetical protein
MTQREALSPSGTTESANSHGSGYAMDRYLPMVEAGLVLGMSGGALRKKFDRGDLPRKFLLRVGPKTLRVDVSGLVKFLKGQATQMSA